MEATAIGTMPVYVLSNVGASIISLHVWSQGALAEDELLCKTYKNGKAKLRLCEIEMEDFIHEVSYGPGQ